MDKKTLEREFLKLFYEARIGDHDKARLWRWISANYISKAEHEQQLKQVEKLGEIYFNTIHFSYTYFLYQRQGNAMAG